MDSLTSLSDTQVHYPLSSDSKDNQKAYDLGQEIVKLERKKGDLIDEVKKLELLKEETQENLKTDTEVKRQEIRKKTLISEIGNLLQTKQLLKEGNKNAQNALNTYSSERINFISSLSHALSLDVEEESKKILKKSNELDKDYQLIVEMSDYYMELANILASETRHNAILEEFLKRKHIDTVSKEKQVNFFLENTKQKAEKADRYLKIAEQDLMLAENDKMLVDKDIEKHRAKMKAEKQKLKIDQKKILAREEHQERREKELKAKEIRLKDERDRIERAKTEFKRKGIIG